MEELLLMKVYPFTLICPLEVISFLSKLHQWTRPNLKDEDFIMENQLNKQ